MKEWSMSHSFVIDTCYFKKATVAFEINFRTPRGEEYNNQYTACCIIDQLASVKMTFK